MDEFKKTLACKEKHMGTSHKCKSCDVDCKGILNPDTEIAEIYVDIEGHKGLPCL